MEVDKHTFPSRLLDVLEAIAEAHFVSFDLELSGVPVKQPKETPGKPSLQDRYLETKRAAEQFQILQIGLTCVKDEGTAYVCKPYNFNLSPVIQERLDVDRTFSFHSGAVEFLLGVGFKMDLPFTSGVPYLSRSEAQLAQERATARQDKSSYTDIDIRPEDIQALEFTRRVRQEVDYWVDNGSSHQNYLVIGPIEDSNGDVPPELNRFERRLVHQLVRAEYPDLVSFPNRGLIRINKLDPEREEYFKSQRKKEVQERIARQTGFRWIVEALSGNAPEDIDVKSFTQTPQGSFGFVDLNHIKSRFNTACQLIRGKKTALFGHNLFLDLVYFYKTFVGELPDKVEEFSALIHELFPIIVDTKYMATHNCGDINPQSSLEQIAEKLSLQQTPQVKIHEDHDKYNDATAFHEAGYDSMLTAQIAVRLSAKLDLEGSHIEEAKDMTPATPPDDGGGVELNGLVDTAINGVRNLLLSPIKALTGQSDASTNQTETKAKETDVTESKKSKKNKKKKSKAKNAESAPPAQPQNRFAHATAFDQLQDTLDESNEDTTEDSVLQFDTAPADAVASDPVVVDTDGISDTKPTWDKVSEDQDWLMPISKRDTGTVMPEFDSDFWKVYGNKLRVFGTQEAVAVLC